MGIAIKALCRGQQCVYLGVFVDGPTETTLKARVSAQGTSLPVQVHATDTPGLTHIVVFPEVNPDVQLELTSIGASGTVETLRQDYTNSTLTWQSRLQGKTNRRLVDAIRNYREDPTATYDQVTLAWTKCRIDQDGTIVLQAKAKGPQTLLSEDAVIGVLDANATSLVSAPEATRYQTKTITGGLALAKLDFCVRIPAGSDRFIVSVDAKRPVFEVLPMDQVHALNGTWYQSIATADGNPAYEQWFLTKHRPAYRDLEQQIKHRFSINPKFSIVVPLYKTPLNFLRDMSQSALTQTYDNLELILVNATPEDEALCQAVADIQAKDQRVKVVTLKENLGITENTNYGIAEAAGDFVCFFDHDDVLEPNALFEYVKALEKDPQIDLFYCDEDKLLDGHYCMPYFKPDWNLDLVRSINYVCHFLTVRRSIIESLDQPTRLYDGAQDWHLTFRAWENGRHMHHVPRILYHWRIHPQSTAATQEEKPYAHTAAKIALQHHLDRTCPGAEALESNLVPYNYQVKYPVIGSPAVRIVIPAALELSTLSSCLTSVFAETSYPSYQVTVAYYGTDQDGAQKVCRAFADRDVKLVLCAPGSPTAAINQAARQTEEPYTVILDETNRVSQPDWIEVLLGVAQRPEVGAVGAKVRYQDGTVASAGMGVAGGNVVRFSHGLPAWNNGYFNTASLAQDFDAQPFECLMVDTDSLFDLGGLDEDLSGDFAALDLCLTLKKAGKLVVFEPRACLTKDVWPFDDSKTLHDSDAVIKQKGILMQKWPAVFSGHSNYLNPHFSPESAYFDLDVNS